jgi:hypothetical protein
MPAQYLLYAYLTAAAVAVLLVAVFRRCRWYWHILSVLLGLAIGLPPPPPPGGNDLFYLTFGAACVFFVSWGTGGFFFPRRNR